MMIQGELISVLESLKENKEKNETFVTYKLLLKNREVMNNGLYYDQVLQINAKADQVRNLKVSIGDQLELPVKVGSYKDKIYYNLIG